MGFGENRIGALIRQYPERKPEIEAMQKEMSYYMLATFADAFQQSNQAILMSQAANREAASGGGGDSAWHGTDLYQAPVAELEAVLGDTVLKEFKVRLGRIGIDYQSPERPVLAA